MSVTTCAAGVYCREHADVSEGVQFSLASETSTVLPVTHVERTDCTLPITQFHTWYANSHSPILRFLLDLVCVVCVCAFTQSSTLWCTNVTC